MRFGRSRRLRSVPKNTGTTAQSLAGAAPAPAGGAATGATERVVGRSALSLSAPLVISSLLAPTLGGGAGDSGGGGGDVPEGGGGDDAEGGGGDDGGGAGDDDAEGAGGGDGGGAGGDDAEGAGGGDGEGAPTAGPAGATERLMAKVLRLGSAPVGADRGAEAVLGDGAMGRAVGADPTGGAASLAKLGRL
jgi:hypothetical protein